MTERMGTIKKIQYDCRHATFLIEKRQQTRLTLKERTELFIHLMGCSVCRLFQRQSRAISRSLRHLFRHPAIHTHTLDEKFKQEMQDKINEQMSK
ncbi:MAG: hypothetical protein JST39_01810 [Bacteroidetes bacterium]|nr:hypothetical protein [Bacteroidota bacterium]